MPAIIIPQDARPSYGLGFARSAAESAYPNLWPGLESAWVPAFGQSGTRLYDVIGKYHGTFSGITAATGWVLNDHGPAILCNAISELVDCGDIHNVTDNFTIVADVVAGGAGYRTIAARRGTAGPQYQFYIRTTTDVLGAYTTGGVRDSSFALVGGVRYGVSLSIASGGWIFGCNGQTEAVASQTCTTKAVSFSIGNNTGTQDNTPFDGQINAVLFYGRALPAALHSRLTLDPIAPLRLRRRTIVMAAAAPSTGQPTMRRWGGVPGMMLTGRVGW